MRKVLSIYEKSLIDFSPFFRCPFRAAVASLGPGLRTEGGPKGDAVELAIKQRQQRL
jgi:hypothetical protein